MGGGAGRPDARPPGGWAPTPALLHTRPASLARRPATGVSWLEPSRPVEPAALAHLPEGPGQERRTAARSGPSRTRGRRAGRCRSPTRRGLTERWFDLSVDALEPYRRRGLAGACVEALIARLRTTGREAVWGALADNEPALRLAGRLGSAPVAEITVFRRPAGR